MSNKLKKYTLLSLLVVALTMAIVTIEASATAYDTSHYDMDINVNENNSAYITEHIALDVKEPMHGIYRYIPLSQKMIYKDGEGKVLKRTRSPIKIDDISVPKEMFEVYDKNGNRTIQIGNPEKLIIGKQHYNISYLVKFYDDEIKEYDSFIYNLIPHDWETPIGRTKINLTMPKAFDPALVTVEAGIKGSKEDTDKITWQVYGNTISIEATQPLPKGSGISVGISLPEGYFVGELSHKWTYLLMAIVGSVISILLILLWFRYGRDKKTIKTVEFYPPEGINAAELGYIIDGRVDKQDVVSLLFYFAQGGYLEIEETSTGFFAIKKLKDLPADSKPYERKFFNGLFREKEYLQLTEIGDDFYDCFLDTKILIEEEFENNKKQRIFPKRIGIARCLAAILSFMGLGSVAYLSSRVLSYLIPSLIIAALIFVILMASVGMGIKGEDKRYVLKRVKRLGLTLLSIFILIVAMGITFVALYWGMGSLVTSITTVVMEIITYLAMRFMQSRTKYGTDILGKILGFKEFIQVSELGKLEMLVEENPKYFYDVLPYAYVMGISKKWAKKFETIQIETPTWYKGTACGRGDVFNTWMMYSFISEFGRQASRSISIPVVGGDGGVFTGGSFGDGGGFSSGGGFGGGGGGSW